MYIGVHMVIKVYKGYTMMGLRTATHSLPIRSSQAMQDKKARRTSAMCHFGRTSFFDMKKMTIPAPHPTARGTWLIGCLKAYIRAYMGVFRGVLGVYIQCIYMYNGCT